VALIVETTTDNRNRTVSEIRHALGKYGGNLGEANSVAWMFSKKGLIVIPKSAADEEKLMNIVLEAGGDDIRDEGEDWEIYTEPSAFEGVREAIQKSGIETSLAQVTMVASTYQKLEGTPASAMVRLLEFLEDHDDVQNVYSNLDMDAKQMEEIAG
jgi:YebC/PmpR family DNA-binding regulatory protein